MRGKKNEGKQEAENEMEPDKDDKREEDGDRQEKKQTRLSLCQTHYSPSHTHTDTHTRLLTRTTLTSHYLKEIFYSTLVSVSHRHICGGQLQLPMSCFPLLFILVDAAVM